MQAAWRLQTAVARAGTRPETSRRVAGHGDRSTGQRERVGDRHAPRMLGELDPLGPELREAVEDSLRGSNRKAGQPCRGQVARLEVAYQYSGLRTTSSGSRKSANTVPAQVPGAMTRRRPGNGRRRFPLRRRRHSSAPADGGLGGAQLGAGGHGVGDLGADASFDQQVTGPALEHALHVAPRAEAGKASGHFARAEHLYIQAMRCAGQHARQHGSIGRADLQQADFVVQAAAPLRPVARAVVGVQQQRHVVGMFEIRLADDARLTVRAATIVARRKAVEAQHASCGELAPPRLRCRCRRRPGRLHRSRPSCGSYFSFSLAVKSIVDSPNLAAQRVFDREVQRVRAIINRAEIVRK